MHPNETAIHDFVDDALDAHERAEIERHLESCAACRQVVDDLREIRSVAASLEPRDPPVRVWTRLERAIKLAAAHPSSVAATRSYKTLVVWLAAAPQQAASQTTASAPQASTEASATEAAQSVETELRQAEDHYEKAIKGLEQIAAAEKGVFDPRTAATLQKNLAVIDQAIGESRAALRSEPTSEPAQQSLMENFKAKMGLLQDTVALINEMRKGNDAGAARVVSGLKQRGD